MCLIVLLQFYRYLQFDLALHCWTSCFSTLYQICKIKRQPIRPTHGLAICKCSFTIVWLSTNAGTHRWSLSLLNGWDSTRVRGSWGSGTPGWNGWLIFVQNKLIMPMSPVFSFRWYVWKNNQNGTEIKQINPFISRAKERRDTLEVETRVRRFNTTCVEWKYLVLRANKAHGMWVHMCQQLIHHYRIISFNTTHHLKG